MMADIAARREARKRRILNNLDNRIKKITGELKEDSIEEKSNSHVTSSKSLADNGYISTLNNSVTENKISTEEKLKPALDQDDLHTQESAFTRSNVPHQQSNSHVTSTYSNYYISSKKDRENCDNLDSNPTTLFNQTTHKQFQFPLSYGISNPTFYVLLSAIVNILLLTNVNISFYKGIVIPYLVVAMTQLCLEIKSEEPQDSNMLAAALILCNIKPEIVHTFKKVLSLFNTTCKNFAIYLTSFVLFNWLISTFWINLNDLQFL